MAHLRKKGDRYYAEFYDPDRRPKRKWVALRLRDKQAARTKLVRLEREHAHGDFDPWADEAPQDGVTVAEAVEAYVEARGDKRRDTRATDRAVLGHFAATLAPGATVERVEPRHVRAFLDKPKRNGEPKAAATKAVYLARVQTFFDWCASRGWRRAANPAVNVRSEKVGKKLPLFLTREEVAGLVETIGADAEGKGKVVRAEKTGEVVWLADAVRVTAGTGLRASELCHLRWGAVDLKNRILTVKASPGFAPKSYHERPIPLAGEALDTLTRLAASRDSAADGYVFAGRATRKGTRAHLDRQYLNKRFKHYAALAGLDTRHTFHSLRRTYASWLVQGGVDLYVVQKLLGHADIKTTMKYAFLAPDNLTAAVEKTFGTK